VTNLVIFPDSGLQSSGHGVPEHENIIISNT